MKSDFAKLNMRDVVRGLLISLVPVLVNIVAFLKPILSDVGRFPSNGEWIQLLAKTLFWVLSSLTGYLVINFVTNKNGKIGK
jgi:hypothetical protein